MRLERVGAARIERVLAPARVHTARRRRRGARAPAIGRRVAIRTGAGGGDPAPGFAEADRMAPGGPLTSGRVVRARGPSGLASGGPEGAAAALSAGGCGAARG